MARFGGRDRHHDAEARTSYGEVPVAGDEDKLLIEDRFRSGEVDGVVAPKVVGLRVLASGVGQLSGELDVIEIGHEVIELFDEPIDLSSRAQAHRTMCSGESGASLGIQQPHADTRDASFHTWLQLRRRRLVDDQRNDRGHVSK